MLSFTSVRCGSFLTFSTLLIAIAGCDAGAPETHPVSGTVIMPDGTVASRGVIEFRTVDAEGNTINAHSMIQPDGTFRLSTFGEEDGALAGTHQVILLSPAVGDGESLAPAPGFPPKYRSYETSGLEFEIKPGENDLEIKLQ